MARPRLAASAPYKNSGGGVAIGRAVPSVRALCSGMVQFPPPAPGAAPGAAPEADAAVRRLGAPDAAGYRALRLEGLAGHPEAFGASWEEEAARPLAWFAERLERNAVFGGWTGGGPELAGVAGLLVPEAAKLRHKGVLWGMYVRPPARRTGMGAALLARVLDHARGAVEEVRLTVVASNAAAVRFYEAAGFETYGVERRALKVAGRHHDEALMALRLDDGAAGRRSPDG